MRRGWKSATRQADCFGRRGVEYLVDQSMNPGKPRKWQGVDHPHEPGIEASQIGPGYLHRFLGVFAGDFQCGLPWLDPAHRDPDPIRRRPLISSSVSSGPHPLA